MNFKLIKIISIIVIMVICVFSIAPIVMATNNSKEENKINTINKSNDGNKTSIQKETNITNQINTNNNINETNQVNTENKTNITNQVNADNKTNTTNEINTENKTNTTNIKNEINTVNESNMSNQPSVKNEVNSNIINDESTSVIKDNKEESEITSLMTSRAMTQIIPNGEYVIEMATNRNKVLTIEKNSNKSGANVAIYEDERLASQIFKFFYLGDGYYKIQAVNSGKVLDVYAGLKQNGANVDQYEWNNTDAQKWFVMSAGNGYYNIISKCNGLSLDVYAGLDKDGTNVQMYKLNNSNAQKFVLRKLETEQGKQTIKDGIYTIASASDVNKVVAVDKNYNISGANVQLETKKNLARQQFRFIYLGNGCYKIQNVASGKVLDVYAAGRKSGTNVDQYEWNNTDAQKWIVKQEENGKYSIISYCNYLYLDIYAGLIKDGTNMQVYRGNGTKSQQFSINESNLIEEKPTKTIENGIYNIRTAIDTNRYLESSYGSIDNFANIQIWSKSKDNRQQFKIEYLNDGYYKIQSVKSGKVLDVYAGENKNGANVDQYTWNGTDAQKWIIKETGDGSYSIISKCNGLYLDIYAGENKNGSNVQVYENNNTISQKFVFLETSKTDNILVDGIYSIRSVLNRNMSLDVLGGSQNDGANVGIWRANSSLQQKFKVEYIENGYYEIQSMHSGKMLDVYGGSNRNGTNVDQYRKNGSDAQKWYINTTGDGSYFIVSKCNGLYLDIYGANMQNGTNVQVYQGNKTNAQKFVFETTCFFGIDVSIWQGNIDFNVVQSTGKVDFMIPRAGWYSETRNKFMIDTTFQRNYTECKRRNIPVGTYIYSYAVTEQMAISEAEALIQYLRSVRATTFDIPIYFDIEDKTQASLSREKITSICIAFCETIKKAGYKTGIYTNKNMLETKIDLTRIPKDYSIWVASYGVNNGEIPPEKYQYKGAYDIWQYTSVQTVPGIEGDVDMNISNTRW